MVNDNLIGGYDMKLNKNEKQRFINYLRKEGFSISPVLHRLNLVPHYYKTPKEYHTLIDNISCCLFDGSNTKPGDLGCVTFYYGGTIRHRYCRKSASCELLKKAFCPKTANETIKAFKQWRIETAKTLTTWKMVI